MTAYEKVCLARAKGRPTSKDYILNIFDEFVGMHGDRRFADDKAIIAGIGEISGIPVTVIGIEKGANTKERVERNFGSVHPEGYRKALRQMKLAEKFNRPVICFVDTSGAYCGIGAEERGQGEAIARNIMEMFNLKVPILVFIIGEGSSGGALAIGVGDEIVMLENAVYSVLSPEGYASILWKDGSRVKEAAEKMKMTAQDLKKFKVIDKIIDEPIGGAQHDVQMVAEALKKTIVSTTKKLKKLPVDELVQARYEKFRNMGEYIR